MLWIAKDRRTLRFVIPHALSSWSNVDVIFWRYKARILPGHRAELPAKGWRQVAYSSPKALTRSVYRTGYGKG